MKRTRASLMVVGALIIAYGAFLLVRWQSLSQILEVVEWAAIGVILHDAVLAPLSVGIGWFGRRWLPNRVSAWITVATILIVTTTIASFAVLTRSHGGGKNHTLLDRNYPLGLLLVVATIVGCVAVGYGASVVIGSVRRRTRGASTGGR